MEVLEGDLLDDADLLGVDDNVILDDLVLDKETLEDALSL